MGDHADRLDVVTGAFGYTGKYIAGRLLEAGGRVTTLTGRPLSGSPFGDRVEARPLSFDRPDELRQALEGARALFNTYWVRFSHGKTTFRSAVENTKVLLQAAQEAGVRRVVHTSITNPSLDSPLPYFSGKAELEEAIRDSGLSYAILRPTVIFGQEDILINNIAWILRKFPVFAVAGRGDYRLQPIFVEDFAKMAVDAADREDSFVLDAVGPETFTFDELVRLIAKSVGRKARLMHLRPGLVLFLSTLIGWLVHDVVLTREEVDGLKSNLLISDQEPTGTTRLSDWLAEHGDAVGSRYASELRRHYS
jgi:uncharacterized protein YbjT (DUF2867 family)